jgi:amino acid adenylation domain-containing protein
MSGIEDIYELSPLQRGMLLHSRYDGDPDMYLSQHVYTVDGPLDAAALVRAWQQVFTAHPALRTSFHWDGLDKPLQVVHRDVSPPAHRFDWSGAGEPAQRERMDRLLAEDRGLGFDLAKPPLQRLYVVRLGTERYGLAWSHHHLLLDGWSVPIFMNEVMARYQILTTAGPPPPPPPAAPPFRDYIAWLRQQDLAAAQRFWTDTMAGFRSCHLAPLRAAGPRQGTGTVDRHSWSVPGELERGLRTAAARHRVTLSALLQAAWAIALRRYTGTSAVTFGCVTSGRPAELTQVDRMVGLFANTLPVPVTVPDHGEVGSWLRDLQNRHAQMRRYEFSPLADIKRWAGAPGQQLFESLLSLDNYSLAVEAGEIGDSLTVRTESLYDKVSVPLSLVVTPEPVSQAQLVIHRDRFEPGFADDALGCLRDILAVMVDADRIEQVITAAGPPVAPVAASAAPAGATATSPVATPPVPAATPQEEAVAAVYREVLAIDEVDVTRSFFELGGDSFAAVRAISRIEGATVGMLAANPSVREFATALAATGGPPDPLDAEIAELERQVAERAALEHRLAEKRAARQQRAPTRPLAPVPRDGPLACTYQQEAVWFEQQLDPSSAVYHIPFVLRLRGALAVPALQRALHALVVRHEALRTRFVAEDGLPRQVVDPPPADLPMPVRDLPAGEVVQWAATEVRRPFDLAAGPLVRTTLASTAPDEHVLVLVVHHIIADGLSVPILAGELAQLYQAEISAPGTTPLPELPVQPADHAAWQRGWLSGDELDRQLAHWRQRLAGLPTIDFPADRPRPADPSGAGATTWRRLPDDLAAAGRGYARASQVSFLAVLHAALLTVLHRYTGQTDLPVGSIFSGRTRAELEPLVGYFVNAVVLRIDLDGDPSFAQLVHRCYDTILDATSHQDLPFSLVVDALKPDRVAGRNPLFQIGLELQPARTATAGPALGEVTAEPLDASTGRAHFDLNVVVYEATDGSVDLSVEYATELFDADRIDRFIDHYLTALARGLASPDQVATGIEVMPPDERHRVLYGCNGSTVDYPAQPLHRMVETAAAATPDAIAVVDHDGTPYTYRWLDSAANRLGNRLRRDGVGSGDPVGVCLRRGIDLVTALLATWKAGGGYLPLEPDLPADRLAAIVADAKPSIVVTSTEYTSRFPATIALDSEPDQLAVEPDTAPDGGCPDDLAYLLYPADPPSSPTGVPTSHRAAHNWIAWLQDTSPLRPDDRVLQTSPYGHEGSVWELFWPLVSGATAVLAAPGGHGAVRYLHQLIESREVTTVHLAPTTLDTLLAAAAHPPPSLRRVFCSGEALPARTTRRLLRSCPQVALHNLYRPDAACAVVTGWRCEPDSADVLIGRPIANTRAYVLDDRLRPAPTGIPGRLFIAGTGAPGGYHQRPALTAGRLLPDPFANPPGPRMYATGDLARWHGDGTLELLGRTDQQVRLRGQRADPDRIADALAQHPDVRQCAVVLRDPGTLTAYLVGDAEPSGIRRFLADRLPSHLIPTTYLALPALPLTRGGTLDLTSLPAPPPSGPEYLAPRTDTEQWLADTWQGLLGVPRVGVRDDFFTLGANSLHLTQLAARIRDHLNIDLPPRQLFAIPTLEQLATLLAETDATPGAVPITPVPRDHLLPGTYQQEGLWFVQQLDPGSPAYHIGFGTRLRGELDVPALRQALHALVVRHEALRTRFVAEDGVPRQVIDPPPESLLLPVSDLSAEAVQQWTDQEVRKPLDLARGPVFRTALARVAPDQHVLALVVHHIVADGWSVRILAAELAQLYAAASAGTGLPQLPQLPAQPADHAVWQRGWLTGAEMDRRLDYWRDTLADLPTIDLPTDQLRPANPTGAGTTVWRRVPDDLAAAARTYARDHQVSFLALLQAALLTVLHRYTGQTDLPIGSIFSGRTRTEIEPMVGYFVNAVVLRTRLDGQPSFADLVRRCHDTVVDASGHQDTPFGLVVDALQPERVTGRNPLFQVALSLLPAQAADAGAGLGALRAEPVDTTTGRARFDLAINVDDAADGALYLSVEYSIELFEPDRIDRLIGHYLTVLANGLAEPDRTATDLEIMSLAERQQVLPAWNPAPAAPAAGATATSTGERGASW